MKTESIPRALPPALMQQYNKELDALDAQKLPLPEYARKMLELSQKWDKLDPARKHLHQQSK